MLASRWLDAAAAAGAAGRLGGEGSWLVGARGGLDREEWLVGGLGAARARAFAAAGDGAWGTGGGWQARWLEAAAAAGAAGRLGGEGSRLVGARGSLGREEWLVRGLGAA